MSLKKWKGNEPSNSSTPVFCIMKLFEDCEIHWCPFKNSITGSPPMIGTICEWQNVHAANRYSHN